MLSLSRIAAASISRALGDGRLLQAAPMIAHDGSIPALSDHSELNTDLAYGDFKVFPAPDIQTRAYLKELQ